MPEADRSLGLCSTCMHAPACTFPRDPRRPVFDCDGFETEVAEPVRLSGGDVMSAGPRPDADPDADDCARDRGLCTNCESRASCTFPRPEGGVWHCEEYL